MTFRMPCAVGLGKRLELLTPFCQINIPFCKLEQISDRRDFFPESIAT